MSDDLVKRLDNLWSMLEDEGFYTKANTAILAANRIEELEAKLAKAVEALVQMVGKKDYADDPWGIARTTLAELKGQNGER
jgi:hypothetical protein